MTSFLLIRHGENEYMRLGRLAGWTPGVHLNAIGRRQAMALAEHLRSVALTAIYSSPLERARETAAPLARLKGLRVRLCAAIGEVRYGRWDGRSIKALLRTALWRRALCQPSAVRFPGGETVLEVQIRAVTAIEKMAQAHPHGQVAVFTHADVIKLIVAHYWGIPLDLYQRMEVAPVSVTRLVLSADRPPLIQLGESCWARA